MSLIDGAPRSATVVAREPTEILELDSDAVLARMTPTVWRKLVFELSSRVRRTHDTVADLADKVYHAAYANVNAAVRVELDTIKTLYQRTEATSQKTLEQAEQRSRDAVDQAKRVADGMHQRIDGAMKLITKRLAPIVSAAVFILGAFGIHSYLDLQKKYSEALGWHEALGKFQDRMHSADKALRVISETMTDLRSARDAGRIHAPVQTPAELRRAALDFEHAKSELFERYIASADDGVRYEHFDPEVVFEAVDTFVELAAWGRVDGEPALSPSERTRLIGALTFVVKSSSDTADATSGAQLLIDRKLRDTFYQLALPVDGTERKRMLVGLERILEHPASRRAKDSAALILASLDQKNAAMRDVLADMAADGRPSRAATGAIALAKLGHAAGWKQIRDAMGDRAMRYAFASLLAQEGRASLQKLARTFGDAAQVDGMLDAARRAIADHAPNNCYEERYDRWLAQCLADKCPSGGAGPIGGDCTLHGR